MLHAKEEFACAIEVHNAFVVGAVDGGEELWGDGEEGEVFDVGVAVR